MLVSGVTPIDLVADAGSEGNAVRRVVALADEMVMSVPLFSSKNFVPGSKLTLTTMGPAVEPTKGMDAEPVVAPVMPVPSVAPEVPLKTVTDAPYTAPNAGVTVRVVLGPSSDPPQATKVVATAKNVAKAIVERRFFMVRPCVLICLLIEQCHVLHNN